MPNETDSPPPGGAIMGDKGSKDKGKREAKKEPKQTPKEKRAAKKEKKNQFG